MYSQIEDLFLNPSALAHMVNILLDQSDIAHALVTTDKADELEGYVTEMLRIDPPIQGVYRQAKGSETIGSTSINTGELVYLDISSANLNVGSQIFRPDCDSHDCLGACIRGPHEDRSFTSQR